MFQKHSLGQNFLRDKRALGKIADTANVEPGETVLEIGPGDGALTGELISRGAKVIAVEKDDRLIPILSEKFGSEIAAEHLKIINEDILSVVPSAYGLEPRAYSLVANIPYYITGEIIRLALSVWPQPKKAVLLVQKEVAQRIVARDGKESLLSTSVKAYGTPKIIGIIKAGAFSPAPGVDSAILAINDISKGHFPDENAEKRFFEVVKAGFAHKRKLLQGNLKPIFGEDAQNRLLNCGIPEKSRAEEIPLEKWLCLASSRH